MLISQKLMKYPQSQDCMHGNVSTNLLELMAWYGGEERWQVGQKAVYTQWGHVPV